MKWFLIQPQVNCNNILLKHSFKWILPLVNGNVLKNYEQQILSIEKEKQSMDYLFVLSSLSSGWFFHLSAFCCCCFFFIMSFFCISLVFFCRSYIHTNIYVNIVKREKRNQMMYYWKERKKLEFVVFFLDEINCNEQQPQRRQMISISLSE